MNLAAENARLRDEVDTLTEEIRQLRELLAPETVLIREEWRLTRLERRLFRCPTTRDALPSETLLEAVTFDRRKPTDGNNYVTIYIAKLRQCMDDNSVDHVFGDPPYEKHMHDAKSGRGRKIRQDGYKEFATVNFDSIEHIRVDAAEQMVRVCRGWLIVFCTPEGVTPWRDAIEAAGGNYKRACHWIKPDAAPQFNGQGPAMGGYSTEIVLSNFDSKLVMLDGKGGQRADGPEDYGTESTRSGPQGVNDMDDEIPF